ncbi:MAG: LysR family transcriptional regulator [Alphaproteobacteria bacterium]
MDIELAKTFLIIAEEGSFRKTAERLNVTQSTVSTRMQTLESALGKQVFLRGKKGVFFTAAGLEFKKYAENMVSSWQQIKQKVMLSSDCQKMINLGYENSIYNDFIINWTTWSRKENPDVAVKSYIGEPRELISKILETKIDFAIISSPQNHFGIMFEEVVEEKFVLVSSVETLKTSFADRYIYIDWGEEFRLRHSLTLADFELAAVSFNQGEPALKYILQNDAAGYFPERIVKKYIKDKKLFIVKKTPNFSIPTYLCYLKDRKGDDFVRSLEGLRNIIRTK